MGHQEVPNVMQHVVQLALFHVLFCERCHPVAVHHRRRAAVALGFVAKVALVARWRSGGARVALLVLSQNPMPNVQSWSRRPGSEYKAARMAWVYLWGPPLNLVLPRFSGWVTNRNLFAGLTPV